MLLLIPKYKINGAGFAYLIAVLPTTLLFMVYIDRKLVRGNNRDFYRSLIAKIGLVTLVLSVASIILLRAISSLPAFFLCYGLTLAIGIVAFFLSGLGTKQDMDLIKSFVPSRQRSTR
jgi:O-antigen/teichoic acid export membrane protein